MTDTKTKFVCARCDQKTWQELQGLSSRLRRTNADVIRLAIERFAADEGVTWNIELGKYCSSINADCDICEKSDRCQELTNAMRE